jgi:putative sugar O-methyltransferase
MRYNPSVKTAAAQKEDTRVSINRLIRALILKSGLIARVVLGNIRLTSALTGEWGARYQRSRKDFLAAEPVFHPGRQWTIGTLFFRMTLRGLGVKNFKSTFGRILSTYEPGNRWLFEAVHHLYYEALKPRDRWGLLEKLEEPDLGDGTYILYNGKRLSLDLLQSIDELYRVQDSAGFGQNDRVVFCELGAGYGRLADVVLSAMPNAVYMIFDLPESLLLSQNYLTARHPEAAAALYPASAESLAGPRKAGARLIFGLPHEMRAVKSGQVDAFINVYSFMEMNREQIDTYFTIIDGLQADTLYLKQHKREANIYDGSFYTSDTYPFRPYWTKSYEGTCVLFEHVFEAAYRLKPVPRASTTAENS